MAYVINAPINLVNTNGTTDTINFNADGPTANAQTKIANFVVTSPGDMLYRAPGASNHLERLPLGSSGQVLTVSGGLPSWQSNTQGAGAFTAYITGSTAGIPTSRVGGAAPSTWFSLSGNVSPNPFVTWTTNAPGVDLDSAFGTTAGAGYGRFVAPSAGIYQFDCQIAFDYGVGVNAGAGITAAPAGTAVRQVQIYNVTTSTALATSSRQNEASNLNHTLVGVHAFNVSLSAGDVVEIRVRHDRSDANVVTIGDVTKATSSQSFFAGRRVR